MWSQISLQLLAQSERLALAIVGDLNSPYLMVVYGWICVRYARNRSEKRNMALRTLEDWQLVSMTRSIIGMYRFCSSAWISAQINKYKPE
jgi:hypothetical protein